MKIKGLRWWIITLIGFATIINYIDRSALSLMWPAMGKDLGMSDADYALILNLFMISYAIGQSVSGKLFDKIGTRLGFVIAIFVWSLSSLFHFAVKGLLSLAFVRITLGISEAGNWPGAVKSNSEWFPLQERAIAQGIFNAGASIGSIIAPLFISAMFVAYGWKTTFIIIGAMGLLWIIPWLIVFKKLPKDHPWITEEEKKHILDGKAEATPEEEAKKGMSITQILSHKESWGVIICRFFMEPIWWLFVGWMPLYLQKTYGFDVKQIGLFAWVPYVGAALGSLAGGWYSGMIIAKTKSVDKGRKQAIVIAGIIMFLGLMATIFFGDTPTKFVIIVSFVLFGFQFAIGNIQTLPSDLMDKKSVGTLAGLGGSIGVISVITMNFLIPVITKTSYTPAFIIIAAFVPLGVLSIFALIKKIRPVNT
ncbi:MFS transporter [Flavobacterium sp. WW92]|uniref:MFS transporter n=1 Tax=unclassified Flavobacterium TaxID=196869 RepID=UPI0022258E20|nr:MULTISPECIES: MFS transporter [unclassified Flavobacterium]WDO11510.1 MFS transporter [Flavobacterium sp. WW92]